MNSPHVAALALILAEFFCRFQRSLRATYSLPQSCVTYDSSKRCYRFGAAREVAEAHEEAQALRGARFELEESFSKPGKKSEEQSYEMANFEWILSIGWCDDNNYQKKTVQLMIMFRFFFGALSLSLMTYGRGRSLLMSHSQWSPSL